MWKGRQAVTQVLGDQAPGKTGGAGTEVAAPSRPQGLLSFVPSFWSGKGRPESSPYAAWDLPCIWLSWWVCGPRGQLRWRPPSREPPSGPAWPSPSFLFLPTRSATGWPFKQSHSLPL